MQREVSIDIVKASMFSILLMLIAAVVFTVPFFLIWQWREVFNALGLQDIILFIAALLLGVVLHEGIHGLTWGIVNRDFRPISFGVIWKFLTPYCHYSKPMSRNNYIWGAIMPFLLLGILPAVLSLFTGNVLLLVLGIIFISGAAVDLWMTWLILKEDPKATVLDHPSEAGFFVIDNN